MTQVEVDIVNALGLHLRAAARFVEVAGGYPCAVKVSAGAHEVDGKSLLGLSSLLARQGSTLHIRCDGPEEGECAAALRALVADGFPGIKSA
ncbi:MAG: HPr family phosphocarrier protein [Alphaproteobacteria bacterium]|nr:HPr family phosphocarrier protein [Alphaproteobacteria bacterium]